MVSRWWDDRVEQAFTARTDVGENSMKTSKKSKKTIQKKVVLQKKAKAKTNNKMNKAQIKTKKAILKIKTTKAKAKAQAKVKRVASRTKGKPQVKTKAALTPKAKTDTQIKTGKIVPKNKIKTPVKTKKAMPKAEVTISEATKKATKEIVSQNQDSIEVVVSPVDVRSYSSKEHENYMNKKQLNHFRATLLQWKERLVEEIGRAMHHPQDEVFNHPDPIDRASKEEEFNLEVHTRDRKRKLLKKIEEALISFDNHSYGYCNDCGAEIGIRRLEVYPTATQCIECKTVTEVKEKQVGETVLTKDTIQD